MARKSTGCANCRQRRILCDKAKPTCRRCITYGVRCPGYNARAAQYSVFIDQGRYAAQKCGSELVASTISHPSAASDKQLRWQHYGFLGKIGQFSPSNGHMYRSQLLDTFLNLSVPSRQENSEMAHLAFLGQLPFYDTSTALMQASIDALCLAQIGSVYEDTCYIQNARKRYLMALQLLARELAKPKPRQTKGESILAAVTILALCELFVIIADDREGGRGWMNHTHGATQFIKIMGSDAIESPFGQMLLHNVRHSALILGLVQRKAVFLAEPKWLRLVRYQTHQYAYTSLYDIVLRIPGLLERADSHDELSTSRPNCVNLLSEIHAVRDDLKTWYTTYFDSLVRPPYEVVDIRDMKNFSAQVTDQLYRTAFAFISSSNCIQYLLQRLFLVIVDNTILNLQRNYGVSAITKSSDRSKDEIERDMFVAATSCCRAVPSCLEPSTLAPGRMGTLIIGMLEDYFKDYGHEREALWCQSVKNRLQTEDSGRARRQHNIRSEDAWLGVVRNKSVSALEPYPLLQREKTHRMFLDQNLHDYDLVSAAESTPKLMSQWSDSPGLMICRFSGKVIHRSSTDTDDFHNKGLLPLLRPTINTAPELDDGRSPGHSTEED